MSDTDELLTGRAGTEAAQGYQNMVSADPVNKPDDTGLTPQDLADDDSSAQRHLSRPSSADFGELVERPYLDVRSGERVPENKVVTSEQAAHDLSSVRAAEALELEKSRNSDLNEALDWLAREEAAQRAAQTPHVEQQQPQEPPPNDFTPQVQAEDLPPPQYNPDLVQALQNPAVRQALEATAQQIEATNAAYQRQLANASLTATASFLAAFSGAIKYPER